MPFTGDMGALVARATVADFAPRVVVGGFVRSWASVVFRAVWAVRAISLVTTFVRVDLFTDVVVVFRAVVPRDVSGMVIPVRTAGVLVAIFRAGTTGSRATVVRPATVELSFAGLAFVF